MFTTSPKTIKNQIDILGCTRRTFAMVTGISERHIYRLEKQKIKPRDRSRKVLDKVDELCEILIEIFGRNESKINDWLNKPNKALNGISPIKHILSASSEEEGIEQIIDLLKGFKLGVAS